MYQKPCIYVFETSIGDKDFDNVHVYATIKDTMLTCFVEIV